jgi:hypothetical protein
MKHVTARWVYTETARGRYRKGPFDVRCDFCSKGPPDAFEFISTDGAVFYCHGCMSKALEMKDKNGEHCPTPIAKEPTK